MPRKFMIFPILLILLSLAACGKSTPSPTETVMPSAAAAVVTPAEQPTATSGSTVIPPAGIGGDTSAAGISTCPPTELPNPDWPFYCDDTHGFLIQYPSDATAGETDAGIPHIDLSVLPGTNLGEKYAEINVTLNRETCSSPLAEGYVPEAVGNEELVINGLNFVKQSGSDAGAGNYYNWISYSTSRDGTCVSVDFVLHSTNRYNYPTPPPEFDMDAETAVIGQMMDTFRWVAP